LFIHKYIFAETPCSSYYSYPDAVEAAELYLIEEAQRRIDVKQIKALLYQRQSL
jgi:hypothetical protein